MGGGVRVVECTLNGYLHVCFNATKIMSFRMSNVIKTQNSQWKFCKLISPKVLDQYVSHLAELPCREVTELYFFYFLSLLGFTLKTHSSALHDVSKGNYTTVYAGSKQRANKVGDQIVWFKKLV